MVDDQGLLHDEISLELSVERPRLVRLCARLSGDPEAADDLAQETLLEAWRFCSKRDDRQALAPWLAAIARNICMRWRRRRGREAQVVLNRAYDEQADRALPGLDESHDYAAELERHELAALLDRALADLPAETRLALTQHYLEGLSHAAIAARLGLSEGAVAVRIHRGKAAFRGLLAGKLRHEAEAFGLVALDAPSPGWTMTRIWCPECGCHRLLASLNLERSDFSVRCPQCSAEPGLEISNTVGHAGLFDGISGFKAAYSRTLSWAYGYYRSALATQHTGMAPCWECGRLVPLSLRLPHDAPEVHPSQRGRRGVYLRCSCQADQRGHCSSTLRALTLHLPEARQFWRAHPRIRYLPEREVEHDGRPALVTGFESLGSPARFEVIALRDTYEVIRINGASRDPR